DLAALRTFDVTRALDMVSEWPGVDGGAVEVYAEGRQGIYGRLAALLDERIRGVEVVDGMESFESWVTAEQYDCSDIHSVLLRGVLKYFDLEELEKRTAI